MPSTFTLTRTSLVAIWGDSLNDPLFPYQAVRKLIDAGLAAYRSTSSQLSIRPGVGGVPGRTPVFINKALSGSTISAVNTTIDAAISVNAYTHHIIYCGTNERTRTRAQTQADITTMAGKFGSLPVLLVGPYAWGEKYPTGQNDISGANDTRLDETDTDLSTLFVATHANVVYVSPRTTLYTTTMPALNTPSPGASIGPYTVDGTHFSPAGRTAMWNLVSPYVVFS